MLAPGHYRPSWFRWYACGLLLLATTINYMDRQTLSTAAVRVKADFDLTNEQYGDLEMWFGYAFAFGALGFGVLADCVSVRWLYPAVLVAWSAISTSIARLPGRSSAGSRLAASRCPASAAKRAGRIICCNSSCRG